MDLSREVLASIVNVAGNGLLSMALLRIQQKISCQS